MIPIYSPGMPLASFIDHTLLKPGATESEIVQLCAEAVKHQFYSVCVNSSRVPLCRTQLSGTNVKIAAVVGFPLGAMASEAKAFEAAYAAQNGAEEIDMVISLGAAAEGNYETVSKDIAAVVRAVEGQAIVKVILETGMFSDEQKVALCNAAAEAGAHYVKTSTGFGPGGATEADIRLMRSTVDPAIGVKASGGIRDAQSAIAMLLAGASRLGTSAGIAIVSGDSSAAVQADSTAGGPEANQPY